MCFFFGVCQTVTKLHDAWGMWLPGGYGVKCLFNHVCHHHFLFFCSLWSSLLSLHVWSTEPSTGKPARHTARQQADDTTTQLGIVTMISGRYSNHRDLYAPCTRCANERACCTQSPQSHSIPHIYSLWNRLNKWATQWASKTHSHWAWCISGYLHYSCQSLEKLQSSVITPCFSWRATLNLPLHYGYRVALYLRRRAFSVVIKHDYEVSINDMFDCYVPRRTGRSLTSFSTLATWSQCVFSP
jgi:hypothetical protein